MSKKLELAAAVKRLVTSDPQRFEGLGRRLRSAMTWIDAGRVRLGDLLQSEPALAQLLMKRQSTVVQALLVVMKRVLDGYEQANAVSEDDVHDLLALHWLLTDPDADPPIIGAPDLPWRQDPSQPPAADCRWLIGRRALAPGQDFARRWYAAVADSLAMVETGTGSATDSTAMRPAKEFLDPTFAKDYKALRQYLKAHPWIRTEKPNPQRLMIHAGDWMRMRAEMEEAARREMDAVGSRKQKMAEGKQRRSIR